jgi:hypothetical protein
VGFPRPEGVLARRRSQKIDRNHVDVLNAFNDDSFYSEELSKTRQNTVASKSLPAGRRITFRAAAPGQRRDQVWF